MEPLENFDGIIAGGIFGESLKESLVKKTEWISERYFEGLLFLKNTMKDFLILGGIYGGIFSVGKAFPGIISQWGRREFS